MSFVRYLLLIMFLALVIGCTSQRESGEKVEPPPPDENALEE